jgi:hypothetical protein
VKITYTPAVVYKAHAYYTNGWFSCPVYTWNGSAWVEALDVL